MMKRSCHWRPTGFTAPTGEWSPVSYDVGVDVQPDDDANIIRAVT